MSIRDYVFSGDVEFADALGDYIEFIPKNPDVISISKSDVEAMSKHFGLIDGWVSVDDRLPDNCGHNHYSVAVLGYCEDTKCIYTLVFDWEDSSFRHFYGNCKAHNITHWKPLPQPPKGTDK